jgi:hypothetical protein
LKETRSECWIEFGNWRRNLQKSVDKWTFDELKQYAVRTLFDALLKGGSGAMLTEFHIVYNVICQWQEAMKQRMEKDKK